MKPSLSVQIGPLLLPNPVGVASGTFGYGQEYSELVDLSRLGALYTKAVTLEPRQGNPPPRLAETDSGLLNSIGLANPGLSSFLKNKLPELSRLPCPVIVNVAGSSESDYAAVVEGIEGSSFAVSGYEINVSCPNVAHGGMAFGTDASLVERLTSSIRKLTRRALIVKLSPNVTDIAEIGRAAEAGGADGLSCINTLVGMSIDTRLCRPRIGRGTAGLSGPAIRPVGVACVYRVSRAVKIPVIGLGGISTADNALEYLLAGASAIQVGTALFSDPGSPAAILQGIETWMEERDLPDVKSIAGLFRP
ncbi:MAG TPA: dihydroorotate dehydrogenase [Rectinemataceae bacterium]